MNDELIAQIGDLFIIESSVDNSRLRGRFQGDSADIYVQLRPIFAQHNLIPTLERDGDQIILAAIPQTAKSRPPRLLINLILLLLTVLTTLLVGANGQQMRVSPVAGLLAGLPFTLGLLLILGAHELGHYFAARWHRYPASLPYFIPCPPPFSALGTLGAVITMRAAPPNRRALFDVAVAGPIAGLLFAVPILIVGLATSEVAPVTAPYVQEGNSLLYVWLKQIMLGRAYPANGLDVQLSQLAWAGWGGLLVTALNLLPVGYLDGGHISAAIFGRNARHAYWFVIASLVAISLLFMTPMWLVWIGLLLLFGRKHAQPLDDVSEVGIGRKIIAFLLLICLILTFVPVPLQIIV